MMCTDGGTAFSAPWRGLIFGAFMIITFIALTVLTIAWLLRWSERSSFSKPLSQAHAASMRHGEVPT
jgi:hypothetical protein